MVEDKITGVMIYYYFVCQRKLWFSLHGIAMESENENVQIGKALDELSYRTEKASNSKPETKEDSFSL